jgi:hypothetical protein
VDNSLTDTLIERFHYDSLTGVVTYKIDILHSKTKKGNIAGCLNSQGYLVINIEKKQLLLHRVAWFLYYGYWPKLVDHENLVKSDNRISNLRDATSNLNAHNKAATNKLKTKGVRQVLSGKYVASIKFQDKAIYLGSFNTLSEASEAYQLKAEELFS